MKEEAEKMITYSLNKKGYNFVKELLNKHHIDSVNGEWQDGEFDSAIDQINADVNFMANGKAPEYCDSLPKFHMFASENKSGESKHFILSWDMFSKHEVEQGDRA